MARRWRHTLRRRLIASPQTLFPQVITSVPLSPFASQKCVMPACGAVYGVDQTLVACPKCGNLLDVKYEWDKLPVPARLADFERFWSQRHEPRRFSGVWRFHELLPFAS